MDVSEKLINLGAQLLHSGLVAGAGGNLSLREGDAMHVSPSGFSIGELYEEDLVIVDIATGTYAHPANRPTCEYLMHLNIYRSRPEINVIIHAHPPYVVGISSSGNRLGVMTPDQAAFLHPIRQIPYIEPGGEPLARAAADAIGGDATVLVMENHGAIALGTSCREAYMRMELLEEAAVTQFIAASAGKPRFLSPEEIEAVNNLTIEKYRKEIAGGKDK